LQIRNILAALVAAIVVGLVLFATPKLERPTLKTTVEQGK